MKRILIALAVALALTMTCAAAQKAKTQKSAELIDINTATADQLKAIPGIGDAYSAKIIKGHRYKAKSELAPKNILPQHVYDKIKDQIIAKQK